MGLSQCPPGMGNAVPARPLSLGGWGRGAYLAPVISFCKRIVLFLQNEDLIKTRPKILLSLKSDVGRQVVLPPTATSSLPLHVLGTAPGSVPAVPHTASSCTCPHHPVTPRDALSLLHPRSLPVPRALQRARETQTRFLTSFVCSHLTLSPAGRGTSLSTG